MIVLKKMKNKKKIRIIIFTQQITIRLMESNGGL